MKGFPIVVVLVLQSLLAFAFDPSPLQDFCVAINDARSPGMLYNVISCMFLLFKSLLYYFTFSVWFVDLKIENEFYRNSFMVFGYVLF